MKKFLLHISIYMALLVILISMPLCYYEYMARRCYTQNPYRRINYFNNLKDSDADLIILANSRGGSYDAEHISKSTGRKCLNLCGEGYPFDYQYHIAWKKYIANNQKPKYIIVDVGPFCFFDHVNPIYSLEMLPYISEPEFDFYVDLCPEISTADRYFLYSKYFGLFGDIMREIPKLQQPKILEKKPWDKDIMGQQRPLECNERIVELFKSFLDECSDSGIQVVLICSPLHTEDGEAHFDMTNFWRIIYSCVGEKQIPVINHHDLFGNDTTYFWDPVHVNQLGIECFTQQVIADLDSLGIIQ